jgi:hypothetical protein
VVGVAPNEQAMMAMEARARRFSIFDAMLHKERDGEKNDGPCRGR